MSIMPRPLRPGERTDQEWEALIAAAPAMLAALRLIQKGFRYGALPDQTITTAKNGRNVDLAALSEIVDAAITKATIA